MDTVLEIRGWAVKTLLTKQSGVGGAEGTATLNRSVVRWLERCRHCDVAPPQELIAIVARQLNVDVAAQGQKLQKLHRQREIVLIARALDPDVSNIKLAHACNVSLPTIARRRREVEPLRSGFEAIFATMTNKEKNIAIKEIDFPWLQKLFRSLSSRKSTK
jgi:hypothetical protein